MVERSLSMWEVRGSMPRSSSILFRCYLVVDNRVAHWRFVHFVSFSIAPFEIYIIVFNRPNLQYKNSKTNKAPGGVEPSTFCLLGRRSNQLSYRAICASCYHPCAWLSLTGQCTRRKKKSPRRGIEPRSPAWQAGILTTILTRIDEHCKIRTFFDGRLYKIWIL